MTIQFFYILFHHPTEYNLILHRDNPRFSIRIPGKRTYIELKLTIKHKTWILNLPLFIFSSATVSPMARKGGCAFIETTQK